jgi:hypothetical protein
MDQSRQEFNEDLCQLLEVFGCMKGKISQFALLEWTIAKQSSELYLSHPPVFTYQKDTNWSMSSELEITLEDNNITKDPDVFSSSPDTMNSRKKPIQWDFSIVYSDTYRVPVLYFRAQTLAGSPCPRTQILEWLPPQSIEDSWNFLSQEEHPFDGLPSFFLHPCQTSSILKTIKDTSKSKNKRIIWIWMSLTMPVVNHPIDSAFFMQVQLQIDKMQARAAAVEDYVK